MSLPDSAALADVPVFPLPRVVLFPRRVLPLRIFEPRYRAMFADCIERPDPLLVIAQLRPGFESDYYGRPPIYEIGGLGRVVGHRTESDGSYGLVLTGLCRVRVTEQQVADCPYRRAAVEPLIVRSPESNPVAGLPTMLAMVGRVAQLLKGKYPGFELALPDDAELPVLVDSVADQLLVDPEARQQALELVDLGARYSFVLDQLTQLHLELSRGTSGGETLH